MWYTAGSLLIRGVSILTAPVFTRLLLPEQYSTFSVFLVWATLLSMLCSLYVHGAIPAAHAHLHAQGRWPAFLSSMYTQAAAGFAVSAVVLWCFQDTFARLLQIDAALLPLLLLYSFVQFGINAYLAALAQEKRQHRYFLLSLLVMAASIGLSLYLVITMEDKLQGRLYGQVLPAALIGVVLYARVLLRGRSFFVWEYWRLSLTVALPLLFQAVFFLLPTQSNRVMLIAYGNADMAGIYSVAFMVCAVLEDILMAFNMSWVPMYYDLLKAGRNEQAGAQSRRYAGTMTMLTLGFMLVSPEVYRALTAPAYHVGTPLLVWIAAAAYVRFLINFLLNYLLYNKRTGWTVPASIAALCVNIGGNALLIPRMGGTGAALSTIAAYLVLAGVLWWAARRHAPMPHRLPIGGAALVVPCIAFCLLTQQLWWARWLAAAVCGIMLLRQVVRNRGFF